MQIKDTFTYATIQTVRLPDVTFGWTETGDCLRSNVYEKMFGILEKMIQWFKDKDLTLHFPLSIISICRQVKRVNILSIPER